MTEKNCLLSAGLLHWFMFNKENSGITYTKIVHFQNSLFGFLH